MPTIKSIAVWRPHPPFFYGWLLLGSCLVATFAGAGLTQQVLGGIQTIISDDTGWSRSQLAFAATAGSWTAGALTPFVGRLADRYGPRGLMPIAALVAGLACISLAGANSLWQFYLPFIIGRALVNSTLIGIVPRVVAVNFFDKRRGLALGISSMGRPVGSALNIQIMSALAVFIGWRASYRYYLGIFSLALIVPLALIMRHKPEDIGLHPDGDTSSPSNKQENEGHVVPEPQLTGEPAGYNWKPGEAVRTRCFWLIGIAISLETLTIGVVQFQVVPYLRDSGLSMTAAAGALSASSLLGAGSAMAWGHMADRYHPRSLALIAAAAGTAIMPVIMVSGGGWQAFFLLLLLGSFQGGLEVMGSSIVARYYGRAFFGSIMSLFSPSTLIFLGLGPTLGALLIEATGSFAVIFLLGTVTHLLIFLVYSNASPPNLPPSAYVGSQAVRQHP